MAERPYSELLLLRIPVGMRADFDRYFEEQLAADRARSADPDPFAVKQQTINRLIAEAEGTTSADGRGFVPFYDGEYKGYHLRPPCDDDRPAPNAWGTLRTRTLQAPQSPWVRIGLVVVAGLLAVWLSAAWSLRNAPALAVAKPTPTATASPTPTTPPALATQDPGMLAAAAAALSGESLTPNLQAPSSL